MPGTYISFPTILFTVCAAILGLWLNLDTRAYGEIDPDGGHGCAKRVSVAEELHGAYCRPHCGSKVIEAR